MRGKVRAAPLGAGDAGITPACAGKRSARSAACLAGKDHPRVCGEKLHSLSPQLCVHGSPPRVRGKGCCGVGIPLDCGITPACAGKSNRDQTILTTFEDHPRVCGEKLRLCEFLLSSLGSPPRVRGKAASACLTSFQTGITPACAGKSYHARYMVIVIRDHPRVCGEKQNMLMQMGYNTGSPPRVRGKVFVVAWCPIAAGITPACAGKRQKGKCKHHETRDHPRVCGEKRHRLLLTRSTLGSPPRVRGKVFVSTLCRCVRWDHPRVCGEKMCIVLFSVFHLGSPPRVRGKD